MTFDVKAYTRSPIDLRPDNLDLSGIVELDASSVAAVDYLWQTERGVLDLMRDVLVTPTHAESEVTAFLVTWGYEQYWLTQALHTVLAAHGGPATQGRDAVVGRVLRTWDERARPLLGSLRTNLLGEPVVAAHLLNGWLDTAALALSYQRLAALEPRCEPLVAEVLPMKERHLAFYAAQLHPRLADTAARRHARRAARSWRWPGTRYAGHAAVLSVVEYLLADPVCRDEVATLDGQVATFPGVVGLTPFRSALGRFLR